MICMIKTFDSGIWCTQRSLPKRVRGIHAAKFAGTSTWNSLQRNIICQLIALLAFQKCRAPKSTAKIRNTPFLHCNVNQTLEKLSIPLKNCFNVFLERSGILMVGNQLQVIFMHMLTQYEDIRRVGNFFEKNSYRNSSGLRKGVRRQFVTNDSSSQTAKSDNSSQATLRPRLSKAKTRPIHSRRKFAPKLSAKYY